MWHYLKFFHYYLTTLIGVAFLVAGDYMILLGFMIFIGIYVLGDSFLGDDLSQPTMQHKWIINIMLYSALPLSVLLFIVTLYLVAPNDSMLISVISPFMPRLLLKAQAELSLLELLSAIMFLSFLFSGAATIVAHELVHRVRHKVDVCIGRWLMAFSLDANFSIEHVYHHHAKVCTEDDPVSAPRGRNVYVHFIKALWGTNLSSWQLESKRLRAKNRQPWSWHNRCIRGYLMSLSLAISAYVLGHWQGLLMFLSVALMTKFLLEVVNYMEHYGLVRAPKTRVRPCHSWNTNRKLSSWTMFNLTRHSHHHAQSNIPFEQLKALPEAPQMIGGYISTMIVVLIPPLWFRLMERRLEYWDHFHATEQERYIIARQGDTRPRSFMGKLLY